MNPQQNTTEAPDAFDAELITIGSRIGRAMSALGQLPDNSKVRRARGYLEEAMDVLEGIEAPPSGDDAEQGSPETPHERLTRYVESARVQTLVPIAYDALQAASNSAALYDQDLEAELDDVARRLEQLL